MLPGSTTLREEFWQRFGKKYFASTLKIYWVGRRRQCVLPKRRQCGLLSYGTDIRKQDKHNIKNLLRRRTGSLGEPTDRHPKWQTVPRNALWLLHIKSILTVGFHVGKERNIKSKSTLFSVGVNWYRSILSRKSYFVPNFPANNRSDRSQNCQFHSSQNCSIQCKSVGWGVVGGGGGAALPIGPTRSLLFSCRTLASTTAVWYTNSLTCYTDMLLVAYYFHLPWERSPQGGGWMLRYVGGWEMREPEGRETTVVVWGVI